MINAANSYEWYSSGPGQLGRQYQTVNTNAEFCILFGKCGIDRSNRDIVGPQLQGFTQLRFVMR
jgi:hypothetical protein